MRTNKHLKQLPRGKTPETLARVDLRISLLALSFPAVNVRVGVTVAVPTKAHHESLVPFARLREQEIKRVKKEKGYWSLLVRTLRSESNRIEEESDTPIAIAAASAFSNSLLR